MPRFSETLMEHLQSPENRGRLERATHTGRVGEPGRGPYFLLFLRMVHDEVQEASFECHSCGVTVACGSLTTEWLISKTLKECRDLTVSQVEQLAEGLPADKKHCAEIVVLALQNAVLNSN